MIANILQTRRKTVVLVTPFDEVPIWMSDQELEIGKEIEEKIIIELTRRHLAMISGKVPPSKTLVTENETGTM